MTDETDEWTVIVKDSNGTLLNEGDAVSRIVPSLAAGTHVSTSKNDVNYVVTEFGVAQLRGKSARQRCLELIGIAHPKFRAELRDAARRVHLL